MLRRFISFVQQDVADITLDDVLTAIGVLVFTLTVIALTMSAS